MRYNTTTTNEPPPEGHEYTVPLDKESKDERMKELFLDVKIMKLRKQLEEKGLWAKAESIVNNLRGNEMSI
jgi:hypothetical protein